MSRAMGVDGDERIAYLEARVAALEERLDRRSRELRVIQRHVCPRDLAIIARVLAGLRPVSNAPFELESAPTTAALRPADVEETLAALWKSAAPDDVLGPPDA